MMAQPTVGGPRLAMPSSSGGYPISNQKRHYEYAQNNGEFMLAPRSDTHSANPVEDVSTHVEPLRKAQKTSRTSSVTNSSGESTEPRTPVATFDPFPCKPHNCALPTAQQRVTSGTSVNTIDYANKESSSQYMTFGLGPQIGAHNYAQGAAITAEVSSCDGEISSQSDALVAGQTTQPFTSQRLPLSIEKATVVPVPRSRAKRNIYLDLDVCTPNWSREECQERGRFVIVELKRAVDGHADLQLRAGFIDYSLRMVGSTPDAAEPSIIIKCMYQDVADLQRLFKHAARALGCGRMPYVARLFDLQPQQHPPLKLVYFPSDAPRISHAADKAVTVHVTSDLTLCGSLIACEGRTATIGLSLRIGEQLGLLTVGHLFSDYSEDFVSKKAPYFRQYAPSASKSTSTHHNELCIDDDDQDFSQEPSRTYPPTAARGSPAPPLRAQDRKEGEERAPLIHVGHRLDETGRSDPASPALDFAIVTLEAEIMSSRRTNIIFPHGSSSNARVLDTVAKSPRIHGARVFIVSGASGVYSGRLLDSMDYLGSNIFREMLRVWAVVPDYPAEVKKGDCGSIVVDQETFHVYGHVIGSDCFSNALVAPLSQTMDQIKHTFGVSSVALTDSIANQSPDVSPFSDLFSEDEEIQRSIFAATMPVTDVIPFSDLLATDEAIQPDILEATYMPEYFGYDVTPNAESKSTSSVSISHRSTALTPFSTSSSVPFEENQRQRKRKRRQGM